MSNFATVSLREITTSHNPRPPVPFLQAALADEGYEGYKVIDLVHELALSDDPANKAKFVALIEKYEGESVPKSLVALAESRAKRAIQTILLRSFRVKAGEGYVTHYGIVVGERRFIAAAYNHAKHGLPAEILAEVQDGARLNKEQAFDLAVDENAKRRDVSDYEHGLIFKEYRSRINPATGKKWSLKEIGQRFGFDYQFVRGRHALAAYLPEADQRRLVSSDGRVNITAAIRKALSLKKGRSDDSVVRNKKANRQRALNLSECQQLFDKVQQRQLEVEYKNGYLHALADVMQIGYNVAKAASDERIDEAALAAARKVERQHRKNNAA